MGVLHAEIGSLLVHHLTEADGIASDVLRQGIGGIVVALEHHLVNEVAQQIALAQAHSGVTADKDVLCDADGVSQIAVLEGEQTGHHLRERGHETGFVGVFLAEDHACGVVDEHPGVGREGCQRIGSIDRISIEDGSESGVVDGVDMLKAYLFRGESDATACLITPVAGGNGGEKRQQTSPSEKWCSCHVIRFFATKLLKKLQISLIFRTFATLFKKCRN